MLFSVLVETRLRPGIADPQGVKPGNLMPRVPLSPDELHAVVRYLGTLD